MSGAAAHHEVDVAIVGGGLVGLALAAALAPGDLRVAVLDRGGFRPPVLDDGWDQRVYAISPGSAEFLHGCGVWQHLDGTRLQAIEAMRVFDPYRDAELQFSAYESGVRALAWIVESRALQAALLTRLAEFRYGSEGPGRLTFLPGASLKTLTVSDRSAHLVCSDGSTVTTRVVVGADGANSQVRIQAGLREQVRPYRHTAVVANFDTSLHHQGRAYQWFQPDGGVLAYLPLPGRRMSIVWSVPEAQVAELMGLPRSRLEETVAAAGNHTLGALSMITPPAAFPLRLAKVEPVGARVVLVGDAAHGVHPLAGQGVNLGFGDAAALTSALRRRGPLDAGDALLLSRYRNLRAEAVAAMQAATNGLWQLYQPSAGMLAPLRSIGLTMVDRLGPLKGVLARHALR